MKRSLIILIIFLLNTFNNQANAQLKYTVNESWQFLKDDSFKNINQLTSKIDKSERIDIPHTWNAEDVVDEKEGFYRGSGWYTKTITIPTAYKDKQVFLFFEGVAMVAEVYINKQLATKHVGGFTRFVAPVSKFIDFDLTKEFTSFDVIVKANNAYDDDVPPLHADFTFFGGIYRDVNVVVTNKVHFSIEDYAANGVFITTPKVSAKSGQVHLKVQIKNDNHSTKNIKLVTKIYNPQQELIKEKTQTLKLKSGISNDFNFKMDAVLNPQLWSPDTPNLYQVVCEIYDAKTNEKMDESANSLGFRWFKFDVEEGFFLNGEYLKLIGTNRHQDFKDISNAVPDHIHVEDILRMKAMGSNFLRIAHYPQDAAILEMCDRLGILTTVETPVVDTVTESEEFTKNTLSAQMEMIHQNLEYFKKQDFIAGVNVWNYADFNSEDRIDAVQSVNNKGLVGLDRKPKDVFYYYQASLLKKPFIAIGTHTWGQRTNIEDKEGSGISTMPVQIFSNQKEVELFLNGKSLGIKKVENFIAVFQIPFVDGMNQLKAQSVNVLEAFSAVRINVLPISLKKFPVHGFSVNLGDQRFFYDDKIDQAWMFDKEYVKGSWGHIGGKPYVRPEKSVQQPYGAKQTIKGTRNDPIYQTQLVGIDQYRFDVPPGVYEIKLHFAELEGSKAKHLPYDLGEESKEKAKVTNRTFSVLINDKLVLNNLDVLGQYGEYRAVQIKSETSVKEGQPLIVDFKKSVGEPILNAIEIYKKL